MAFFSHSCLPGLSPVPKKVLLKAFMVAIMVNRVEYPVVGRGSQVLRVEGSTRMRCLTLAAPFPSPAPLLDAYLDWV